MRPIDLLVIPYRDSYFKHKYGSAVRDLQLIDELATNPNVDSISIINRPVSLYERVLGLRNKRDSQFPGIETLDTTSFDIVGPLRKRRWTTVAYSRVFRKCMDIMERSGSANPLVILDFSPFAILPIVTSRYRRVFYWYDMIDNFLKHNRYSALEKDGVDRKYQYVRDNYELVSGVSQAAVNAIGHPRSRVLPNGVTRAQWDDILPPDFTYDIGFIGFVTDKLDVEFIDRVATRYSIVIDGEILDHEVGDRLRGIENVTLRGGFKYADLGGRLSSFKVGVIPYRPRKSHDGSPLKLYEYLKANKPCITSIDYEFSNKFVWKYGDDVDELFSTVDQFIECSGRAAIRASIPQQFYVSARVKDILNDIQALL